MTDAAYCFTKSPLLVIWTPLVLFLLHHLRTYTSNKLFVNKNFYYSLETNQILVQKTKSTIHSKHFNCNSLYDTGKWKNFKAYGFSRKFKNKTVTSIYEPNYPFENPHFNISLDQHFTGTWEGGNCEIKTLTLNELKTCFKGTTKIKIFGDSRSRQLYQSMTAYLNNSPYFYDEKGVAGEKVFPEILSLEFQWSNAFEYKNVTTNPEKNPRFRSYELKETFMNGLNEYLQQLEPSENLIGIIGEHFLWTLKYWNHDAPNKLAIIDNEPEFIKEVFADPFKKLILPWIQKVTNESSNLNLIVLGSHSSVSGKSSLERRKLSQEYNRQLREIIEQIGSEKVKFMDSIFEIGQSPAPDFNPLVVDGTHLNYRVDSEYSVTKKVEQTDVQLAINGILVNTYCEGKLEFQKSSNKNYCCF